MPKFIIAIAAALVMISTSMFSPPAHAGMKGKIAVGLAIGAMAVMAHQHNKQRRAAKQRYYARKKAYKKSYVAKKKETAPKKEYVAAVEPEEVVDVPMPERKVISENSSITTASLHDTDAVNEDDSVVNDEALDDAAEAPADKTETDTTEVGSLGCKKFFASVGMTLSVPCETSTAQ